jgi:4-carboxymuconolactone decarboxylase
VEDAIVATRLPPGHAALLGFVAAASTRRMTAARRELRAARSAGVSARRAEEATLMLVLYAGYPAALNGLEALRTLWPARSARPTRAARASALRARGQALCRRVYGAVFPMLMARVVALHPDLAVWMVEEGYGRVLARPGLSALERELLTVASLAALGWEPQLVSHLLGAERLGATLAQRRLAHRAGLRCARDAEARAAARRAWRRA